MNYEYHNQINSNTGIVNNFSQPNQKQQSYKNDPYMTQVKHPPPQQQQQQQQPPLHQVQYNHNAILNKVRMRLNLYILDYLKKSSHLKTASLFEQELKYTNFQSDEDSLGFLYEWWMMFWSIHGHRFTRSSHNQDMSRGQHPQQPPLRGYPSMQQPNNSGYNNMPMDTFSYEQKQPMGSFQSFDGGNNPPPPQRNVYMTNSVIPPTNDLYRRHSMTTGNSNNNNNIRIPMVSNEMPPTHHGGVSSNIDMRSYQSSNNGNFHHRNKIHPSIQESQMGTHPNVYQDPMPIPNVSSRQPLPLTEQYKFLNQPSSPQIQNFNQMSPVSPTSQQQDIRSQAQQQQQQQTLRMKETAKKKTTVKKLKIKKESPKNPSPKNNNNNPSSQASTPQTPSSDLSSLGIDYGNDDYSSGWSNQSKSTTMYPYTPSSYSKEYSISSPDPVTSKIQPSYNGMESDPSSQQNIKKRKSPEYPEMIDDTKNIINFLDSESQIDHSAFDDLIDSFDDEVKKLHNITEIKVLQSNDVQSKIICCNFNQTGELLATGTSLSSIHIWNTNTGILNSTLESGDFNVTSLSFSPLRDNVMASSSLDGCIRLWQLDRNGFEIGNTMKLFRSNEHGPIHSVDFHPFKENLLCSSETSGFLRLWDIDNEEFIHCIKDAATKQARFSSKGNLLASNVGNIVKVFDIETSQLLYDISGHGKPIQSIYWTDSDSTLITTSEDSVKVWKLSSNAECIGSFSQSGNKKYYAVPHPRYTDSQVIVGAYMSMFVWDYSLFRQGNQMHSEIKAHDGIVSSLSTYGTSLLASTSHDSTSKLWNVEA